LEGFQIGNLSYISVKIKGFTRQLAFLDSLGTVIALIVDMRKLLLLGTLVGISSLAHATTITAPASLDTLEGVDAYSWGISIPVPQGQTVASAEIDFTSVTLQAANSSGTGYLYTDLLNSQKTGVTTAFDNDAPGDYWATQFSGANITTLGSQFFKSVGTTLTWSYVLNASQLSALNSYLTAGTFNIGIDPDCHYSVGSICLDYTLSPTNHNNSVPDAATTALLLALGLGALELVRRQILARSAKA